MTDAPITQSDLNKLEKYLDALWGKLGLDVGFSRHFLDRVNDSRNKKQITIQELGRLFTEAYRKYGPSFAKMGKKDEDIEGVLSDLKTDVNAPFALKWRRDRQEFELLGQTVMRKKNFVPNNPKDKKYTVEGTMFGNINPTILKEVTKVQNKNNAERMIKNMILEEYGVMFEKQLDGNTQREFNDVWKKIISELTEEDINQLILIEQDSPVVNNVPGAETSQATMQRWKTPTASPGNYHRNPLAPKIANNLKTEEEVNELSQSTLKSYAHKSSTNGLENAVAGNKEKSDKRDKGLVKALGKIKEETLDEKKKEEPKWGSQSNFALRMKAIDDALSSKKKTKKLAKSLRSNRADEGIVSTTTSSGAFSSNDTPYDDNGSMPVQEKKKKKELKEDSERHVYHVHFALSPHHKQNVKKYDDPASAEKFKKSVERQGFKVNIAKKKLNEDGTETDVAYNPIEEGSQFYGVDPNYMNSADIYAKNKSFSPNAIRNDGPPNIVDGDDVVFDDNVQAMNYWNNAPMTSQLAARLEASNQYAEAVGGIKKNRITEAKKLLKDKMEKLKTGSDDCIDVDPKMPKSNPTK